MSESVEGIGERIDLGRRLVEEQVGFFRRSFASVNSAWKKDASRVTEADLRISDQILSQVGDAFPEDDLCSEESGDEARRELKSRFCWVIDPVDGTNNFAIGLPNCAISLALLVDGMPAYGWVYDFAGNRLIHGGAGRGLFAGDEPLRPREMGNEKDTPIGLQFPLPEERAEQLRPLFQRERIRSLGSGTMIGVYVALGVLEGAIDFRVKVWDIAAFMAFFPEVKIPCHFMEGSPFPLKSFDPEMQATPYVAGRGSFLLRISDFVE